MPKISDATAQAVRNPARAAFHALSRARASRPKSTPNGSAATAVDIHPVAERIVNLCPQCARSPLEIAKLGTNAVGAAIDLASDWWNHDTKGLAGRTGG